MTKRFNAALTIKPTRLLSTLVEGNGADAEAAELVVATLAEACRTDSRFTAQPGIAILYNIVTVLLQRERNVLEWK